MKNILFFGIIFFCISCSESINDDEGTCINSRIEAYNKEEAENVGLGNISTAPQSISAFKHKGKTYYYIDYGIAFDASAFVLDENCEEVCEIQELINPMNCNEFNDSISGAVKIWPED